MQDERSKPLLQTMVNFVVNGATPETEVNLLSTKLITADNIDEAERIGEVE